MSVPVSFAGQVYLIPQRGETGWYDLTNYLVALSQAQTRSQTTYNVRAISASTSIQSTDTYLVVDTTSGAVTVTLPSAASSQGRLLGVVFATGSNRITITPDGADTIATRTSFILESPLSAAYFFAQGTNWYLSSAPNAPAQIQQTVYTNPTNRSASSSFIVPFLTSAATAASNLQSMTLTLAGVAPYCITIGTSSNEAMIVTATQSSASISCISDIGGIFLNSDAGTGIYVSKSSSSAVVTIKNRLGGSRTIQVVSANNAVSAATAWS